MVTPSCLLKTKNTKRSWCDQNPYIVLWILRTERKHTTFFTEDGEKDVCRESHTYNIAGWSLTTILWQKVHCIFVHHGAQTRWKYWELVCKHAGMMLKETCLCNSSDNPLPPPQKKENVESNPNDKKMLIEHSSHIPLRSDLCFYWPSFDLFSSCFFWLQIGGYKLPFIVQGGASLVIIVINIFVLPNAGKFYIYRQTCT